MKKILISMLIAVSAVFAAQARTFVLATGVSNYHGAANNLNQTTKDAKNFCDVMRTQTKDVTLLTSGNVTYSNVLEKLRAIANRAQKTDRIIFYYSGHGSPGAICATDRQIPYGDIIDVLASSEAKEKIVFVDACYAGSLSNAVQNTDWTSDVAKNGMVFFMASASDEYSAESPYVGAGFFTQALVKGLRGKADKNADKKITVSELFKYIRDDVRVHSDNEQHPKLMGSKKMLTSVLAKWPAPVKK